MADTSFVGESAAMLAEFQARTGIEEEVRRRALRRSGVIAAVVAIHVLFVTLLIFSQWAPIPIQRIKIEPMTWLNLLPAAQEAAKIPPAKAKKPDDVGIIRPLIVPDFHKPQEEENNAIDLGLALGRSLACGASSYEWLNSKMRSECKSKPWQFVYDRYGNIVLDAIPHIPKEDKPRPSDIQAHERNTAPVCPTNVDPNAPCLSSIIGGRP